MKGYPRTRRKDNINESIEEKVSDKQGRGDPVDSDVCEGYRLPRSVEPQAEGVRSYIRPFSVYLKRPESQFLGEGGYCFIVAF